MANRAATINRYRSQGSFWLGFALILLLAGLISVLSNAYQHHTAPESGMSDAPRNPDNGRWVRSSQPRNVTLIVTGEQAGSKTVLTFTNQQFPSFHSVIQPWVWEASNSAWQASCDATVAPIVEGSALVCALQLDGFITIEGAETGSDRLKCMGSGGEFINNGISPTKLPVL